MLYMVVEHFKDAPAIYRRLQEKGRMMPEGLEYVSSWIDVDLKICWQLMRTEDGSLFQIWTDNWKSDPSSVRISCQQIFRSTSIQLETYSSPSGIIRPFSCSRR